MFRMLLWITAISLIVAFSCERITQPTISKSVVELIPEVVMVTEAWFSIKTERPDAGLTVALERDGKEVLRLAGLKDTIVADSGLHPGHGYIYRLRLYRSGKVVGPTPPVSITTMDTTNHDIEWTVYEIPSPYGGGVLYDVAIIGENNIWVVGEIYADSAQPWLRYNAIHWNGKKWELKRITVKFRNSFITPPGEGIFAFAENDIWVTIGGAPAHWDGQGWKLYHLWDMGVLEPNDGGVTSIWGNSQENIYFAGRGGTVVHYEGSSWRRIESGTDLPIQDIWGDVNTINNSIQILCIAAEIHHNRGVKFLQVNNSRVQHLSTAGLPWSLSTLWFKDKYIYCIGGDGIYIKKKDITTELWENVSSEITQYYIYRIRGVDVNDIFAVGSFGEVLHYNGMNWKSYFTQTHLRYGAYYSLDVDSSVVVVTGVNVPNGIILVGKRK